MSPTQKFHEKYFQNYFTRYRQMSIGGGFEDVFEVCNEESKSRGVGTA